MDGISKKRRFLIITADDTIIEDIRNYIGNSSVDSLLLETDDHNLNLTTTTKKKKSSLTCVVCGSSATGYNFDAITCESCKAFFRRNALKTPEELECRRQGQCDISFESRRRCSACRLRKCFQCGMRSDRLSTPQQKAVKQIQIEENPPFFPQTEIEENPSFFPQIEIEENSSSQSMISIDQMLFFTNEQQNLLLSSEDLQRVEAIRFVYEQRIQTDAQNLLPSSTSIHQNKLIQHLNLRSTSLMSLISFFKQIPEFNEINVDDRVVLVKYNLMPLSLLNASLICRQEVEKIQNGSDTSCDKTALVGIFGQETVLGVKKFFLSFKRLAQYDPMIIQLSLIVLMLTKGFSIIGSEKEPVLSDQMAVHRAQNYYTELLWKYLETIHGRHAATQIFSDLVTNLISWLKLQSSIIGRVKTQLKTNELDDLSPIMKSLLLI